MATRVLTLHQTTIGKKAIMAVSSTILLGFVFSHMAANLLVFAGDGGAALNGYGNFLRELLHGAGIWVARGVLLAAIAGHVYGAITINAINRSARPVGYARKQSLASTLSSRTMAYGGMALLAYIIYHIAHLTFHVGIPGGAPVLSAEQAVAFPHLTYDVYASVVQSFQSPAIAGIYILAQVFLGLHLYHGAWSFMQTLGLNHRKYNEARKLFAAAFAGIVCVGFILVPVGVLTGIVN